MQEASQKQQQPLARDSNTEQQQRRSTQARAAPVHVLEASALVSDSEPEQQTESDSEFMAGPGKVRVPLLMAVSQVVAWQRITWSS